MGASSVTAISWSTRLGPSPSVERAGVGRAVLAVGRGAAGPAVVAEAAGAAREIPGPGKKTPGPFLGPDTLVR